MTKLRDVSTQSAVKTLKKMEACWVCYAPAKNDMFNSEKQIINHIKYCTGITVERGKNIPYCICDRCLSDLETSYAFRKRCEESDERFRNFISGDDIKTEKIEDCVEKSTPEDDFHYESCNSSESVKNKKKKKQHETKRRKKCVTKTKRKEKNLLKCSVSKRRKKNARITNLKNAQSQKLDLDDLKKEKEENNIKGRNHMCTVCGKVFLCQANLLDHERIHSGDKPFNCSSCDRKFAQAGHLLVHQRTHSGVKPYKCNVCPRAFSVSHTLKKHLRTHTGERPYSCKLCSKSFVTSYHLSNHHKRHVGDRMYKCDWPGCQRSYVNVSEMKRHKLRHEIGPEPVKNPRKRNKLRSIESIPLISLEKLSSSLLANERDKQSYSKEYLTHMALGLL